jgi:hypothetical protein
MHDKFIAGGEQWAHCKVDTKTDDGLQVVFEDFSKYLARSTT